MMLRGLTWAVVALSVAIASDSMEAQSSGSQSPSPSATAPRPGDTAQPGRSDDRAFVNDMAIAGMAEVQLGKLAAERAAGADVKSFGQMMVMDHSKANDELKQVASQLKLQLPTQLDQKHKDLADRLAKLKGAEFDREYMTAMVQGHEEVLSKLKERAGSRATSAGGATGDRTPGASPVSPDAGRGSSSTGPATPGAQSSGRGPSTSGSEASGVGRGRGEQALTQWAAKTMPTVQQHLERARELQQKAGK